MKLFTLVLLTLFLCCTNARSQTIKGVLLDTFNKKSMAQGAIALLRSKDSTLQQYTRSTASGSFELKNIPEGKYIVLITYPQFADYTDVVAVNNAPLDLGNIKLTLKAHLLEDVTVQQTIATMRMRGDTMEFKADSFGVRQGASVEELLKKIPGIQVDKDGKITAMGEAVPKILVDGEEFFGDDPTITTKGLQAKAVDKVQVFDKKSDQATFTGIDDGQTTKTINLKLKDEMKKGYFGKLDLEGGTDQRWANTGMINFFKKKRKLSAYGVMANTGKTGLDWSDRDKYGAGGGGQYDEESGNTYFYGGGGDDFDYDNGSGQGLPTSWAGAVHYSNKFNDDKQNVNGSYKFNKLNSAGNSNTLVQSILPGNQYFTQSHNYSFNSKYKHTIGGYYEIQIDSFTSLKITANETFGGSKGYTDYTSASLNSKGGLTNNSDRHTTSDKDNNNFNSSLLLRKRFRKPGRTITLNVQQDYTNIDATGFLLSHNNFYDSTTGALTGVQNIDQYKTNTNKTNLINGKITYTEPITTKLFVEVNYGLKFNNNESKKLSYNAGTDGKYTQYDPLYSNSYKYNYNINSTGASVKYNGKKISTAAGTDVAFADFKQTNLLNGTVLKQNFTNLFPKAQLTYKFSATSRINFNYNGSTQQPTIAQIQPVQDNTDPLNIAIGNPNLKQSFRNSFRLNYNNYKVLSDRGVYISGNFSTTKNAISNRQTIDANLRKTYQYVNVNGNYNYGSWMGYNKKIKKWDAYLGINAGINGNRNVTFINGQENINNSFTPNLNFYINKYKEKKYSLSLWSQIGYNTTKSSLLPEQRTNYFTYTFSPSFNVQLPWKMEINVDGEINLRQKTSIFDNNTNVWLINPFIGRKLFKGDKGQIMLKGYDIFNQNKGFNRYINEATVTQNTYDVITRYFSLNFVWNFSKSPATAAPAAAK